jgi:hypothetical protein
MKDSKLIYKGSMSDMSGVTASSSLLNSASSRLKKKANNQALDAVDSESVNFVLLPRLDHGSASNKKENNEGM